MKECMIINISCMAAGSIAIAIACYVTKSACPLLAFMLIPKFTYQGGKER